MEANEAGYWKDIWTRVTSAEWMADTGLPLIATLLGLLLAFFFFRRQLRSDRALRDADHRLEAARALGKAVVSADEVFRKPREGELLPDWEWARQAKMLHTAISRDEYYLPVEDVEVIQHLVMAISKVWARCVMELPRERSERDLRAHDSGVRAATKDLDLALGACGEALLKWDGVGAVPLPGFARTIAEHYERDLGPDWVPRKYFEGRQDWLDRNPSPPADSPNESHA